MAQRKDPFRNFRFRLEIDAISQAGFSEVAIAETSTDAIDYRQLQPALERCHSTLGETPKQILADGNYTNHASVQAAAECGVDFYGSWQNLSLIHI